MAEKLKEGEQSSEQYAEEIKKQIEQQHYEYLKKNISKDGKAVKNNINDKK